MCDVWEIWRERRMGKKRLRRDGKEEEISLVCVRGREKEEKEEGEEQK